MIQRTFRIRSSSRGI